MLPLGQAKMVGLRRRRANGWFPNAAPTGTSFDVALFCMSPPPSAAFNVALFGIKGNARFVYLGAEIRK